MVRGCLTSVSLASGEVSPPRSAGAPRFEKCDLKQFTGSLRPTGVPPPWTLPGKPSLPWGGGSSQHRSFMWKPVFYLYLASASPFSVNPKQSEPAALFVQLGKPNPVSPLRGKTCYEGPQAPLHPVQTPPPAGRQTRTRGLGASSDLGQGRPRPSPVKGTTPHWALGGGRHQQRHTRVTSAFHSFIPSTRIPIEV